MAIPVELEIPNTLSVKPRVETFYGQRTHYTRLSILD